MFFSFQNFDPNPLRHFAVPQRWTIYQLTLRFIFHVYFTIVHWVFVFWNIFRSRRIVSEPVDESDADQWLMMPAVQLAEAIRHREVRHDYPTLVSAQTIIRLYIQRINQVDAVINAVVRRDFERAEQRAVEIDESLAWLHSNMEEFKGIATKKPLLGVPFSVQDKIFTEGLTTTCGMLCFMNSPPRPRDAIAIQRLREAGAIPVCLTLTSEAGLWIEATNPIYGSTHNPYDSRRNACSGEGALVGAGAIPFGLGFDLGGSVRVSALFNGIFGFKTGPDLIPTVGVAGAEFEGIRAEMNTMGLLTRYAGDLDLVLKILAGPENVHMWHLKRPAKMQKLRVYYLDGFGFPFTSGVDPDILMALDLVKAHFVTHFDVQVEPLDHPLFGDSLAMWMACIRDPVSRSASSILAGYAVDREIDFWSEFGRWLAGGSTHTTASLMMCFVEQVLPKMSPEERKFHVKERERLCHDLTALLDERTILLFPGFCRSAYFHNELLFSPLDILYTSIWNMLALPVVTVPVSLNNQGMPVGVQVVSGPQNDRLLLDVAVELEYAFGGWKPPKSPIRSKNYRRFSFMSSE
ncbi:hypothetical protein M3Y95_00440600 [Aphelenchoides besseyi]|nr:hypothetical protein M3Y95_00440600 [Aphelenchoides besseyi]